jgi:hypothetical protein
MADDLDAAVRAWLTPVPTVEPWGEWMRRSHAALIAVLDLHQPQWNGGKRICWHCVYPMGGDNVDWPCETVESIAKELGVEVAGPDAPHPVTSADMAAGFKAMDAAGLRLFGPKETDGG